VAVLAEVLVYGLGALIVCIIIRWGYLFWVDRNDRP
jgi:hypothetical protein